MTNDPAKLRRRIRILELFLVQERAMLVLDYEHGAAARRAEKDYDAAVATLLRMKLTDAEKRL